MDSAPGVGTTFYLYLPALPVVSAPPPPLERPMSMRQLPEPLEVEDDPYAPVPLPPGSADTRRVLVMDDEAPICELAAELLSREGYFVATAADGDAAIRAYAEARDSGQPFDAVILDLTVRGGMGGRETVRRLLEIDPGVRAIVSSGYSQDPMMSRLPRPRILRRGQQAVQRLGIDAGNRTGDQAQARARRDGGSTEPGGLRSAWTRP